MRISQFSVLDAEIDQVLVRELQFLFFKNVNQIHNETFLGEMKERRLKG